MGRRSSQRTAQNSRPVVVLAAILALTLLGTGCASIQPRADIAHIGYAVSAAADVHSTRQALNSGATELNPLLGSNPSTTKLAAMKVAGFAALRHLETSWQRKLGRKLKWHEKLILWGLPIAFNTWAARHNAANAAIASVPR